MSLCLESSAGMVFVPEMGWGFVNVFANILWFARHRTAGEAPGPRWAWRVGMSWGVEGLEPPSPLPSTAGGPGLLSQGILI